MKKRVFKVWAETGCPLWWDGNTLRTTGWPTRHRFSKESDKLYRITVELVGGKKK